MQREFKFRAWWKGQEKFDYIDSFKKFSSYSFPLDWCIIQQYTGLKDKNDTEIYEGDIVKDKWDIKEVRYCGHGYKPFTYYGGGEMSSTECEVIGNIFENPELIKQ